MESEVYKKKAPKFDEYFNLIGYRFRKVGFALLGFMVLLLIAFQIFGFEIRPESQEMVKSVFLRLIILGMLLIAWSKEKEEDERMFMLQVKSMARSFTGIAIIVLFRPLAAIFTDGPLPVMTEETLIISMLFFQIGLFYFVKYNEKGAEQ